MLFLLGSANRDDRRSPDGDTFDIHRREVGQHLTFGLRRPLLPGRRAGPARGARRARGAAQALPEWDVDYDNAKLSPTSTVRGWETLPVVLP